MYLADNLSLPVRCAVKKIHPGAADGDAQVWAEVHLVGASAFRHEALLPLLGFCVDARAPCLVYPLMAGGDLERRVFNSALPPLSWWQRVRIIRDTSRALLFLHTPSAAKGIVLHRDIKPGATPMPTPSMSPPHHPLPPANILLDDRYNARLSDVGLACAAGELQVTPFYLRRHASSDPILLA